MFHQGGGHRVLRHIKPGKCVGESKLVWLVAWLNGLRKFCFVYHLTRLPPHRRRAAAPPRSRAPGIFNPNLLNKNTRVLRSSCSGLGTCSGTVMYLKRTTYRLEYASRPLIKFPHRNFHSQNVYVSSNFDMSKVFNAPRECGVIGCTQRSGKIMKNEYGFGRDKKKYIHESCKINTALLVNRRSVLLKDMDL